MEKYQKKAAFQGRKGKGWKLSANLRSLSFDIDNQPPRGSGNVHDFQPNSVSGDASRLSSSSE